MSDGSFTILDVIKLIYQWRKHMVIVCAIALAGSVVIALLLPNYYESAAIFYASNPEMTNRQNLFSTQAGELPVSSFGKERDADRLMQIARSSQLAAFMIDHFNLFEHYEIDPKTTRYPQYAVNKEFNDNYQVFKNELGAIEVHIIDQDKNLAAKMANTIVDKIDEINNAMLMSNKQQIVQVMEEKLKAKKAEVRQLSDSVTQLKQQYNIVDPVKQAKTLSNKAYTEGSSSGFKTMTKGLEQVKYLEEVKSNAVKELNTLSTLFEQYKAAANQNFSSIYVLERAYPAERKAKPIRWLIVVSSVLATFLAMVLFAAIIEKSKSITLE